MNNEKINTEKWDWRFVESNYNHIYIYQNTEWVAFMGHETKHQQNAELIVTAVNACKEINSSNPLNVAKVLPDMVKIFKSVEFNLLLAINMISAGEKINTIKVFNSLHSLVTEAIKQATESKDITF